MTASDVINGVRINDVAQALGVKLDRARRRGVAVWREGRNFSVSFDDAKNVWHDFVTGEGGGVLDLVSRIRGGSRADALHWVADFAGVVLDDRPPSRAERSAWRERDRAASVSADDIAYWRDALLPELNFQKIAAVKASDDEALVRAASLCNVLENGTAPDIVHEFIRRRESDPADVARLIAAGQERDLEAQLIATKIVLLLALHGTGVSCNAA